MLFAGGEMQGRGTLETSALITAPLDDIDNIDLDTASRETLDNLPIGAIKIDAAGKVLFYNATEGRMSGRDPARVIGRNFFDEIAPCTRIPQFKGRFDSGVRSGYLAERFMFNFDFEMRPPVKVMVELCEAAERNSYWILTKVVERYGRQLADSADALAQPTGLSDDEIDAICASEPIHRPDSIQSWGALVIAEVDTGDICGVSDNLTEIFRPQGDPVTVGAPLSLIVRDEDIEAARRLAAETADDMIGEAHRLTGLHGCKEPVDMRISTKSGLIFFELSIAGQSGTTGILARDLLDWIDRLSRAATTRELCESLTEIISEITGFGRVLIYQFDEEWNGKTIVEAMQPGCRLSSFEGLHFPASDIPPQARAMYRRSVARFTPSRDFVPCQMEFTNDAPEVAHDLTGVQLRSVSPIHAVYHKNIGVNGSMSLSLMLDGDLWGMVICHDEKPYHLSFPQKVAVTALAKSASSLLEALTSAETRQKQRSAREVLAAILETLSASKDHVQAALNEKSTSLMDLFDCSGAAVLLDGAMKTVGNCPTPDFSQTLIEYAFERAEDGVWSSRHLAGCLEQFEACADIASGAIIAFPTPNANHAIIWYLPERVAERHWAGNPASKMEVREAPSQPMILPRQSFAKWTEFMSHRSAAIEPYMIEMAEDIRLALGEFLVRRGQRLLDMTSQLEDQNTYLTALLDSMSEAVVGAKAGGRIVSFNAGAEKMFGYNTDKACDMTLPDLLADDQEDAAGIFGQQIAQDKTVRAQFKRSDGSPFTGAFSLADLTQSGQAMSVVVIRDISDLVQLEANAQQQSKLEALGQLTGSVAHDYNNFLAIVSGNLELLDLTVDNPGAHKRIQSALHAVRRGAELTERLLSLVRNRPVKASMIDITEALASNEMLFRSTLGAEIEFDFSLPDEAISVRLEPGQIENVAINLLNNARDAIGSRGTISLTLCRALDDELGDVAVMTVTDTGCGMTEEVLSRVTEPFFTTKPQGKGTGLGLSALSRIVETANGKLELVSEPGKGTRISIRLPIDPESEREQSGAGARAAGDFNPAGTRLLLVDDEEEIRETVGALLRAVGFDVTVAGSQAEANAHLSGQKQFDIVLTDIGLPEGSVGYDIASDSLRTGRVHYAVCMSGSDFGSIRSDPALAIPLLSKPFSLEEFLQQLSQLP